MKREDFNSIPGELKELPQWVVANTEKVPHQPKAVFMGASPTNPEHWATFDEAVKALSTTHPYLGFVFTSDDPYFAIDLDGTEKPETDPSVIELHRNILGEYEAAYVERSISGNGYHIITKGAPDGFTGGRNDRLNSMEVYESERYFIMSGQSIEPSCYTIPDMKTVNSDLVERVGLSGSKVKVGDLKVIPATKTDDDLIAKMMKARNWDSEIGPLWTTEVKDSDSDKSEQDMALMSHILFYTKNIDQAVRLFNRSKRAGALGRKPKPGEYLKLTFTTVAKNDPAFIAGPDVSHIKGTVGVTFAEPFDPLAHGKKREEAAKKVDEVTKGLSFPPGMIGDIARWVYANAPRPEEAYATATAFAAVAGIAARSYTINGESPRLYQILLGGTGRGKSSHADQALHVLTYHGEAALVDYGRSLISGEIVSRTGLLNLLAGTPTTLGLVGEIGGFMAKILSPKATANDISIRSALMDLYTRDYVAKSTHAKAENQLDALFTPCYSFIGDSTGEELFSNMTTKDIASGFIGRISFVFPSGAMKPKKVGVEPVPMTPVVAQTITTILARSQQTNAVAGLPERVQIEIVPEARQRMTDYDIERDNALVEATNKGEDTTLLAVWGRIIQKAYRFAALMAIADNPNAPVVTLAHVNYAIEWCESDTRGVIKMVKDGEIASSDGLEHRLTKAAAETAYKLLTGDVKDPRFSPVGDKSYIKTGLLANVISKRGPFRKVPRPTPSAKEALDRLVDLEAILLDPESGTYLLQLDGLDRVVNS